MSSRNPVVTGEYYTESYAAGATTFAAELKKQGYFNFAIVKNPWLPAKDANKQLLPTVVTTGFDYYDVGGVTLADNPLHAQGIGAPREFLAFAPPENATEEAAVILRGARARGDRRPFLLYLHYMNTHQPYSPSARHMPIADASAAPSEAIPDHLIYRVLADRRDKRETLLPLPPEDVRLMARARALYDAATASVDAAVGRLHSRIEALGELENTVFIFTSDHGEEFGERGRCGHSVTLYQECVHVPLVVWGPGVPEGKRSSRLVRGIDTAPAVLRLAGLETPSEFEGGGFGLAGEPEPAEAVACTVAPTLPRKLETVTIGILEKSGRKFILKQPATGADGESRVELYDLANDPAEVNNRAGESSDVGAFEKRLGRYFALAATRGKGRKVELTEETEEALRSIGYFN
jgi:arylsulfatase A-like enzyme